MRMVNSSNRSISGFSGWSLFLRLVRLIKSSFEIVAVFEILWAVFIRLSQHLAINQIENYISEIPAIFNSPIFQNRARHRAILIQSKKADTFQ